MPGLKSRVRRVRRCSPGASASIPGSWTRWGRASSAPRTERLAPAPAALPRAAAGPAAHVPAVHPGHPGGRVPLAGPARPAAGMILLRPGPRPGDALRRPGAVPARRGRPGRGLDAGPGRPGRARRRRRWCWAAAPRAALALGAQPPGHPGLPAPGPIGRLLPVPVLVLPACGAVSASGYWGDRHEERPAGCGCCLGGHHRLPGRCWWPAGHALTFLLAWEGMAVTSFFLVTAEDRDPETQRAGWIYLVSTHSGTLCLFAAFALPGRRAAPAPGPGAPGPGREPARHRRLPALPGGLRHQGGDLPPALLAAAGPRRRAQPRVPSCRASSSRWASWAWCGRSAWCRTRRCGGAPCSWPWAPSRAFSGWPSPWPSTTSSACWPTTPSRTSASSCWAWAWAPWAGAPATRSWRCWATPGPCCTCSTTAFSRACCSWARARWCTPPAPATWSDGRPGPVHAATALASWPGAWAICGLPRSTAS